MKVDLTVNGKEFTADVEDRMLLVHFLRDVADLTATNVGCDTTSCGACTVLLDGESVKSCTVLAAQVSGQEITTVEGLASNGTMHPVQQAFHEQHGLQCGFCTPGAANRSFISGNSECPPARYFASSPCSAASPRASSTDVART